MPLGRALALAEKEAERIPSAVLSAASSFKQADLGWAMAIAVRPGSSQAEMATGATSARWEVGSFFFLSFKIFFHFFNKHDICITGIIYRCLNEYIFLYKSL